MALSVTIKTEESIFKTFKILIKSLVLWESISKSFTTIKSLSAIFFERIDDKATFLVFLLIFLKKFSLGLDGKALPPPLQMGLPIDPALALPVPFCLQGFFPDAVILALFFWDLDPFLILERVETTY